MIVFLNYFKLKKFLKDIGYSEFEAREVIRNRIRKLSKPVDRAFYNWFTHGTIPDVTVDGVSFQTLTGDLEMSTMQALLYLDWLDKEPQVARMALRKMKDFVRTAPADAAEPPSAETEDTTDIILEDK